MPVTRTVSIREDQAKWLDDNDISISSLLQRAIDERMRIEDSPSSEAKTKADAALKYIQDQEAQAQKEE